MDTTIDFKREDLDRVLNCLHDEDKEIFLAVVNALAVVADGNNASNLHRQTGLSLLLCEYFTHVADVANQFLFSRPSYMRPK